MKKLFTVLATLTALGAIVPTVAMAENKPMMDKDMGMHKKMHHTMHHKMMHHKKMMMKKDAM